MTYGTIVFVNVPLHFVVTTSAYIEDYADEMAIRYETKHKPTLTNRQEAHWTWQSTGGLHRSSMMWIYGIFVLCYLPYVCAEPVRHFVNTVFIRCFIDFAITVCVP